MKKQKFPELWKKANAVLVHNKEDKNLIKNYRPVTLLPIFSKSYERVIYNALFNYFKDNKLFTPSQSGFLPGDSCIAQLLSIIHEIQTAFDNNPADDVRGVFLDISKAFDKVWHIGLLFKLKAYGVDGELLSLLENYKLEKVQYEACLAITGAIQGTSRQTIYDELGLNTLIERGWCGKLTFFYKIVNGLLPEYLYSYLKFPS